MSDMTIPGLDVPTAEKLKLYIMNEAGKAEAQPVAQPVLTENTPLSPIDISADEEE